VRLVRNECTDHISAGSADYLGPSQRLRLHQFTSRESAAPRLRGNEHLRKHFAIN
jgi:hypothetical protein